MKKEYDFSQGKRGLFYNPEAQLNLPIYLDQDIAMFIGERATAKKVDTQTLVNEWLRKEIDLIQSLS
ncbi:MAG: hypothetical protein HQM12_08190 [SAR324 cluster bacterium]|nr:hypothetical protein [SAR324 cluster bacterium]MBF0352010.1 hypothetical protein [SAR324 cluster bacterium]